MPVKSLILTLLVHGVASHALAGDDPRLVYPEVASSSASPYNAIGTLGDGTAELLRPDLVITAAHVATELSVGESSFSPGAHGNLTPYGSYKVREVIYASALKTNPELLLNIRTGESYWDKEAASDYAFVRIDPINLNQHTAVRPLQLSEKNPCEQARTYHLAGYPGMMPFGVLRSNPEGFPSLGCNADRTLIYFNGLTVRGFSGGALLIAGDATAELAGILVAGGRAPGSGRCSPAELTSVGAQKCGLWAVPAVRIRTELSQIP